jgi:hypothetical protein
MTEQEIIDLMKQPMRGIYSDQYKIIFQQNTGNGFPGCLCGSGLTRLYKACVNYAKQLENNQSSRDLGDQTEL